VCFRALSEREFPAFIVCTQELLSVKLLDSSIDDLQLRLAYSMAIIRFLSVRHFSLFLKHIVPNAADDVNTCSCDRVTILKNGLNWPGTIVCQNPLSPISIVIILSHFSLLFHQPPLADEVATRLHHFSLSLVIIIDII